MQKSEWKHLDILLCWFNISEKYLFSSRSKSQEAKSMDDIKWARGAFAAIRRYKESNQKLSKYDEMIANNTYKQ